LLSYIYTLQSVKFTCFILLVLVFSGKPVMSQTTRINSFDDLMTSLNAGGHVRVITHYSKCRLLTEGSQQSHAPDAIAGMDIDTYEYFEPGAAHNAALFLVFGNSKLIQNPIGKGFVYNYGKVRINSDNTVVITAKYINPKNYKVLMSETFNGKLNDGTNKEGIDLFGGR
jgi:hypothetical protein